MVSTSDRLSLGDFLSKNFNSLPLKKPLFYNWPIGLRFDLQSMGIVVGTDDYFETVLNRATTLFQQVFADSDSVFLVLVDYRHKRRKIRFSNYLFRQIKELRNDEISYRRIKGLYEPANKFDRRNIAVVAVKAERINYRTILSAIANHDFPPRQPRFDQHKYLSDKEVYFLNIDKKLIFDMYDDRGLDIIAADKENLRSLYETYTDWLLDYDREQIDNLFR